MEVSEDLGENPTKLFSKHQIQLLALLSLVLGILFTIYVFLSTNGGKFGGPFRKRNQNTQEPKDLNKKQNLSEKVLNLGNNSNAQENGGNYISADQIENQQAASSQTYFTIKID